MYAYIDTDHWSVTSVVSGPVIQISLTTQSKQTQLDNTISFSCNENWLKSWVALYRVEIWPAFLQSALRATYLAWCWHSDSSWPVIVHVCHAIGDLLHVVNLQVGIVSDDDIVCRRDRSLPHMLTDDVEVLPTKQHTDLNSSDVTMVSSLKNPLQLEFCWETTVLVSVSVLENSTRSQCFWFIAPIIMKTGFGSGCFLDKKHSLWCRV